MKAVVDKWQVFKQEKKAMPSWDGGRSSRMLYHVSAQGDKYCNYFVAFISTLKSCQKPFNYS